MNARTLTAAVLLLCMLLPLFAQDGDGLSESGFEPQLYRFDTGDQLYSLSLAPLFNLFIWSPSSDPPIIQNKMRVGGYISIGWDAYLNRTTSIGAELGYGFANSLDKRLYHAVPLLGRITHSLVQGAFELPISLGAGLVYNSFDDQHYLGVMLKPEISAYYNFDDNWGLGLRAAYWFVPELYFGDESDKTSFGNFLTIQAAVKYAQ